MVDSSEASMGLRLRLYTPMVFEEFLKFHTEKMG